MSFLTSTTFWVDTAERSVKTGAQAVLLALGASEGFNLFEMNWGIAGGALLGGMFISLLTSLASGGVGATDSASLLVEVEEVG